MNDIIIYTFGQLSTFKAVLQSLSVLFDPTVSQFFASNNSLGAGSAAVMASLIAIIGLFSNYLTQSKVLPHGPLLGLMMYGMICIPKVENVWVSDLYTGRTELVQNVPLGIAVIGYSLSTISKGFIEEIEGQYAIPGIIEGDDFLSTMTAGNGFLSPLKVLVSLRQSTIGSLPEHLIFNTASYLRYCLTATRNIPTHVPVYNELNLVKSENPIEYFLAENLFDSSLMTEIMDVATYRIRVGTCEELNNILDSNVEGGLIYYLEDPNTFGLHVYAALAEANESYADVCRKAMADGNACVSGVNAIAEADSLVNSILGAANANEKYMQVRLMDDINQLVGSVGTMSNATAESIAIAMTSNIELARFQEALEGESFLHFMMPAMNALMYLFYAIFPFAMVIMVSKGAQSLVYFAGYLLFGVWIYSWMPIATVINFTTIANMVDALSVLQTALPLTIGTANTYVQQAQDAIAVGSNLLAATPIITLAIISGSIYALTSVAQSASAPSGASAQIAKENTPSYHNSPSILNRPSAYIAANGGASAAIGSAEQLDQLSKMKFNVQSTLGTSEQALQAVSKTAQKATESSASNLFNLGHGTTQGNSSTNVSSLQTADNNVVTKALKTALSRTYGDNVELSSANAQALLVAASAGTGFVLPVNANAGAHASQTDQNAHRTVDGKQLAVAFDQALNEQLSSTGTDGSSIQDQRSNEIKQAWQDLKQNGKKYTDSQAALQSEQQEVEKKKQTDASVARDGSNLLEHLRQKGYAGYEGVKDYWGNTAYRSARQFGFSHDDAAQFRESFLANLDAMNLNSRGGESKTGAGALLSGFEAIEKQLASKDVADEPILGDVLQEAYAKTVGSGFGSDLYQVSQDQINSQGAQLKTGLDADAIKKDVNNNTGGIEQDIQDGKNKIGQFDAWQSHEKGDAYNSVSPLQDAAKPWNSEQPMQPSAVSSFFSGDAINNKSLRTNATPYSDLKTPEARAAVVSSQSREAVAQGASYADAYLSDTALDAMSNAKHGKNFDSLNENQKRQVLAYQQADALKNFTDDAGRYLENSSSLPQASVDAISGLMQGEQNKLANYIERAQRPSHDNHNAGSIGYGESRGITGSAERISNMLSNVFNGANSISEQSEIIGHEGQKLQQAASDMGGEFRDIMFGNNDSVREQMAQKMADIIDLNNGLVQEGMLDKQEANGRILDDIENEFASKGIDGWQRVGGESSAARRIFESAVEQNGSVQQAAAVLFDQQSLNQDSFMGHVIGDTDTLAAGQILGHATNKMVGENLNKVDDARLKADNAERVAKGEKPLTKSRPTVGQEFKSAGKMLGRGTAMGVVVTAAIEAIEYSNDQVSTKNLGTNLSDRITSSTLSAYVNYGQGSSDSSRAKIFEAVVDKLYQSDAFRSGQSITPENQSQHKDDFLASVRSNNPNGGYSEKQFDSLVRIAQNYGVENQDLFNVYNQNKDPMQPKL